MSDPSIKVKSSSAQRRSSGKWPLWGLLMLLAGGAAWCGGTEQGARFAEQSKAKVMALLGRQEASTDTQAPVQAVDAAGRIRPETGPQMVAGAISAGSKPADPEAERDARIDKAVQDARQWSEEHAPAQPVSPIAAGGEAQKAADAAQAGSPGEGNGPAAAQEAPSAQGGGAEGGGPAAIAVENGTPAGAGDAAPSVTGSPAQEGAGPEMAGDAAAGAQPPAALAGGAQEAPGGAAGSPAQAGNEGSSPLPPAGRDVPDAGMQASSPENEGTGSGTAAQDPAGAPGDSMARIQGPAASGRILGGGQPLRGPGVHGKISRKNAPAEAGRGEYQEDGSYGGRLESASAPEAERDDPVVTRDYVADTARWLASCYVPSPYAGGQGRTTATLERINERGGASSLLRSHERDPLKSRQSVLRHVFTPGMIQALGQMYAQRFLDEMEKAASQRRGGSLDRGQTADMFRVYARRFQQASVSLAAAAESDVSQLSDAILQHSASENEANAAFARAYTAQTQARAAGDSSAVRIHSQRMAESSRMASQHAAAQDRARNELSARIRTRAVGDPLPSRELTFLGQWLARRNATPEATRAAADVCRYLSEKCSERADAIEDIAGAN